MCHFGVCLGLAYCWYKIFFVLFRCYYKLIPWWSVVLILSFYWYTQGLLINSVMIILLYLSQHYKLLWYFWIQKVDQYLWYPSILYYLKIWQICILYLYCLIILVVQSHRWNTDHGTSSAVMVSFSWKPLSTYTNEAAKG